MAALMAVLATIGYLVFILVCLFVFKYVLAGITILMGDKQSLNDFGNLCGKTPPAPHWKIYEQKEAEREWLKRNGYDWRKSKDSF
jgi:hypothetical protein